MRCSVRQELAAGMTPTKKQNHVIIYGQKEDGLSPDGDCFRETYAMVAAPGLEPGCQVGPQILSLHDAVLLKFLCGHRFYP